MTLACCLPALAASGCTPSTQSQAPTSQQAEPRDPVEVYVELEQRIDAGEVAEQERKAAYDRVVALEPAAPTAEYCFVRAAVAGRLAEARGLRAVGLVKEVEAYALRSIELDPGYDGGAARRLLGTLYVMAEDYVEEGDSEEGLDLLERLVEEQPQRADNHLRLAEGFIALGDPDPGLPHLCKAVALRDQLRPSVARRLDQLVAEQGGLEQLGCGAS